MLHSRLDCPRCRVALPCPGVPRGPGKLDLPPRSRPARVISGRPPSLVRAPQGASYAEPRIDRLALAESQRALGEYAWKKLHDEGRLEAWKLA